jgi:hypothetical protein
VAGIAKTALAPRLGAEASVRVLGGMRGSGEASER